MPKQQKLKSSKQIQKSIRNPYCAPHLSIEKFAFSS
nr:MAG TPA: hypothetical protein [Caudoviricetes sp.]